MKTALFLIIGLVNAKSNQEKIYELMQLNDDCDDPLEISKSSYDHQMGEFSRNPNQENWKKAMNIKEKLGEHGNSVDVNVNTKEMYDSSFTHPIVRNYEYANK